MSLERGTPCPTSRGANDCKSGHGSPYTRWGRGSAKERAYDLELIYNLAVPVGEINDDAAYEFLVSVVELVRDSVRAKGGDLW